MLTRRGFIRSLGALAATAVVAPSLVALTETALDRLRMDMRSGFIANRTFLFDGPVTITTKEHLTFFNCRFVWNVDKMMDVAMSVEGNSGLTFDTCQWVTDVQPRVVLSAFGTSETSLSNSVFSGVDLFWPT